MARKTRMFVVDPQNDFCIENGPGGERGALVVPGAADDMSRLAKFIIRNMKRIDDIHCSLDSHQVFHIAHPPFWVDNKGKHPDPFTVISVNDVRNGTWRPFNPKFYPRALAYVETLALDTKDHPKRYDLMIWPIHCRIGSWGQSVVPCVDAAFAEWELKTYNRVSFVPKGSNMMTEHYSPLVADVVDPDDISTKLNTKVIDDLKDSDEVLVSGEALSHCVANFGYDLANNFGDENVKKLTLLTDTSSSVPIAESLGKKFVADMVKRGMRVSTTVDW